MARLSSERGSLLVEVMVGAVVLAIATTAILTGLDGSQATGLPQQGPLGGLHARAAGHRAPAVVADHFDLESRRDAHGPRGECGLQSSLEDRLGARHERRVELHGRLDPGRVPEDRVHGGLAGQPGPSRRGDHAAHPGARRLRGQHRHGRGAPHRPRRQPAQRGDGLAHGPEQLLGGHERARLRDLRLHPVGRLRGHRQRRRLVERRAAAQRTGHRQPGPHQPDPDGDRPAGIAAGGVL